MPTTSNFGWTTPADTDLVKDGAAAIRTLGNGVDTSFVDLKGGTTGQVLAKASATDLDFNWVTNPGDIEGVTAGVGISGGGTSGTVTITNSMATTIDAKGDLVAGTGADTFARLAVGANDTVLTADSSTATGLKWATPASSSGPAFSVTLSANQTLTSGVTTKIQFNTEQFDTDNCYDPTTNYRFTPTKAGYYQINATHNVLDTGAGSSPISWIYKNGAAYTNVCYQSPAGDCLESAAVVMYFNGSTDYAECFAYAAGATTRRVNSGENLTRFTGVWIRS